MDCFAESAKAPNIIYGLARKTRHLSRSKKNILIVGENGKTGKDISAILKEHDHEIDDVHNGEQTLALFNNRRYDLLISELIMPGMSGIKLLKEVKSLSPETEVMIVTGSATLESYLDSMLLGAFDYLNKPVKPQVLRKTIEKIFFRKENLVITAHA